MGADPLRARYDDHHFLPGKPATEPMLRRSLRPTASNVTRFNRLAGNNMARAKQTVSVNTQPQFDMSAALAAFQKAQQDQFNLFAALLQGNAQPAPVQTVKPDLPATVTVKPPKARTESTERKFKVTGHRTVRDPKNLVNTLHLTKESIELLKESALAEKDGKWKTIEGVSVWVVTKAGPWKGYGFAFRGR